MFMILHIPGLQPGLTRERYTLLSTVCLKILIMLHIPEALRHHNYAQLSKGHRGEFAGLRNVDINSGQIILRQNYDPVLTT